MNIIEESETIKHITFNNGKKLTLVGSAHVSQKSVNEVREQIDKVNPDSICIELDEDRWNKFEQKENEYKDFDLVKIIKQGKFFLVMINTILSSFQKRIGKSLTIEPGKEIISAGEIANERNIPLFFVDRNISLTLKRAWAKSSAFQKAKILSFLFLSAFDRSTVSEQELEELKKQDNISKMLGEMAKEMPSIKEVLIDERDTFLASKIFNSSGNNKFAIVGQGHANGLVSTLKILEEGKENIDTDKLEIVPKKRTGFFKSYFIPLLLITGLLAVGIFKGWQMGMQYILSWGISNFLSVFVGMICVLANPITTILAAITSPFFALTPVLGVGMFAALIQAYIRKSRVSDLDSLCDDVSSVKGWFKNRILHTFMIFIFSSLFSTLGTLVIFPIFGERLLNFVTSLLKFIK